VNSRQETGSTRLDDAARAGWLYYVAGNTPDQIAGRLCISRQTAQRLVSLAMSEGLIKVRVDHPIANCLDLASRLKSRFALDDAATEELIDVGTLAENEAVDLYHFTSLINRSLDEAGRIGVVEMMWEIVFADGQVNEFEDNLMWRAADLLGVSSRERIAARQRVAGEKAESEGT